VIDNIKRGGQVAKRSKSGAQLEPAMRGFLKTIKILFMQVQGFADVLRRHGQAEKNRSAGINIYDKRGRLSYLSVPPIYVVLYCYNGKYL